LPLYWIAVGEAGMTGAAIVSSATYGSVMLAGIVVFVRQRRSAAARLVPGMAAVRQARRLAGSALAQIPWRARHA
ncbi:MAG TPA: hypothetical protein VFG79_03315, partial [Solirubrobacter sp.]|nr:hypothetical protein [Solirubrobacter sp.]